MFTGGWRSDISDGGLHFAATDLYEHTILLVQQKEAIPLFVDLYHSFICTNLMDVMMFHD